MPLLLQPIGNMVYMLVWIHTLISPSVVINKDINSNDSVLSSIRQFHNVKTGFVCKSESDIVCIDELCNDDNHFWTIEVNGDYAHYEARSVLKKGDKLKLSYGLSKDWRK